MQHQPTSAAPPTPSQRHYGLDWLRIAAFALLILYHIGMVFAPWRWVIHSSESHGALIAPMALLTPWRLPLLFAVSGYASRKLFARIGDAAGFARSRALRLLVPLAFGMAVLVPIEMWVRVTEAGYPHGYAHFWVFDYWRAGTFFGQRFPSWEHLWFLAYLAAYTLVLAGLLAWRGRSVLTRIDGLLARLCAERSLLWTGMAALVLAKLTLLFVVEDQQGLLTDWGGHAHFAPLFLFGFAAAGVPQLWPALRRLATPSLLVAAATGGLILWLEHRYPGTAVPPHALMALGRAANVAMGWAMVLLLFHAADRWANRDHRWRKPLGEAVFPAYLVHQPVIVLTAWYTLPLDWAAPAEFAALLAATLAASLATYLLGRRVAWLRPLIGLAPVARRDKATAVPVPEAG